ncbi:Outer membrane cobalamin receptor protein [Pedobacter steynii]|uniref:Outer membrane cobalamin receptor protein n=1 Tax=Pedobacter steynii TaxID=430522 RepID=A0A1G9KCT7_9SPHI|nr:TonB-dependent receptor [Pedobacter steynii]NQX38512.1 TonB-dependent receptor [Pedobacter steynii]SDL47426.1 Outer membrane cobalamin receptor protein [Pedobacter steynii]
MRRNNFTIKGINPCFFTFLAISWLGGIMPLNLLAQRDSVKLSRRDSLEKVNQLKEVQIRTIKITRRQTSSTPLQILSGADLEKLNSLSVADAVRFFSGVQLKDYGGIGGLKTINVRSIGTNHTAVFYDGVQLGNAQNGQVDLGKFSLDNIEEIELYNGQKSNVFQSAKSFASASSLYLKARTPSFEDGRSNRIKGVFRTGSFGLVNPSLLWQTKITDHTYSTVSAEFKKANGRYKFRSTNGAWDTTGVRTDGDVESMRLELGLNGVLRDSSKWSVKLYGYKDNHGLPGAIVANVWHFSQRQWNRNFFVQSAYEKNIGKYSLMATVKYSNDYLRYLDPNIVTTDGLLNNKYHQQELYLSLANKLKINDFWDVVWSTDYQINDMNANLYRFAYPTRNTFLNVLATQLHFERLDIQANLLSTLTYDKVKSGPASGNRNELTPTVMVSWQPFDQKEFRIRSFYKSIFRMPTFNDLYYTFYQFRVLKPEYTKQYDLGFTYIKGYEDQALTQFSIQADAYFNKVKDKIVAVPGTSQAMWSMRNLGKVEVKGLDVNMQSSWQLNKDLSLNAGLSYTYQQARDSDPASTTYNEQIPYVPLHNITFLASAAYKNFALNYSYLYTGERYDQSANIAVNYVQPFYTHDLAIHYNAMIQKRKVKVTAELNNLLNQPYEVITNYPMPGRSYRFSLTYDY